MPRCTSRRRDAKAHFDQLRQEWEAKTGDAAFVEKVRTLEHSREALRKLDEEKKQRLQHLQQAVCQHQLDRHLQSYRIREANIALIKAGRITTLRSHSIVGPARRADLDREFGTRRAPHEQLLRLGPTALRQIGEQVQRRRHELAPPLQGAMAEFAQAEANAKAVA